MTRAELEGTYKVQGNRIVSPGKFESENIWAPYFWDVAMEGGVEMEFDDGRGVVIVVGINSGDVEQFPELDGFGIVELFEDDNGFVYCEVRP